jgi:hypothetical protein
MPFAALEADFFMHPKVIQLSDREFREHMCTIGYCVRYRTDGLIPSTKGIPGLAEAIDKRHVDHLVKLGLWEKNAQGLWIHDYSEFNGTRVQREQARLRKRAQRERERATA